MMLQWYGYGCFKITSTGAETTVIIDPFDPTVLGPKLSRLSADLLVLSSNRPAHGYADAVKQTDKNNPFIISTPGEYEVKGVFIYGVEAAKKNSNSKKSEETTLFSLNVDGVRIGHLGDIDRTLTESELDRLGPIDILLLPVGGGEALDPKTAHEVLDQIEPRIVIPMEYKVPGIKKDLVEANAFLKEYGIKNPESFDKFKMQKKDLPVDEIQVIMLTPSF